MIIKPDQIKKNLENVQNEYAEAKSKQSGMKPPSSQAQIQMNNSKSLKETLQLDDESIQYNRNQEKHNQNNESFGLDLSNLQNLTSVHDQSLSDFKHLENATVGEIS